MSVQQPRTRQAEGEADSYPDPKRSWGRSGSLLGTWGVLLVAVYLAGWMFDGLVDKSPESSTDELPGHASSAAWQFLSFVYNEGAIDKAENLACDNPKGLTAADLNKDLSEWEAEAGVLAEPTVTVDDTPKAGTDIYSGLVEIDAGSGYQKWNFDITVKADGDSFCVAKVEKM